jgi:hypothetical protein
MNEETKKQFQMFVPDDDGSAMDWLENTINQAIQADHERLVGEIEDFAKKKIITVGDIINLIKNT